MIDFILNNFDTVLCVGFCVFHMIMGIITAIIQHKQIKEICKNCGAPVFEGEKHTCTLTYEELSALVAFVKNLKEGD